MSSIALENLCEVSVQEGASGRGFNQVLQVSRRVKPAVLDPTPTHQVGLAHGDLT